ncbi:MAG: C39 family peptidase [Pirellulales bacterium]
MRRARKSRRADARAVFPAPNREFRADTATWEQVKSRNVVMQKFEYTCGAASLATIFRYCYDDPIEETEILAAAFKNLTDKEVADREKNGLSMEDLSRGAAKFKYAAAVLELKYDKMRALPVPVVVRTIKDDFKHFVVFHGESDGYVYLADPIRGNVRMPHAEFLKRWDGKVLAVVKRGAKPPKTHPLQIPPDADPVPQAQTARRGLLEAPLTPLFHQ